MFVFEDLKKLDERAVQMVVREADHKDLLLALRGASEEVRNLILSNMSKRAAQLLEEDLNAMGPVRLSSVEEAQRHIVGIVRKLEEAGEIVLSRGGPGEDVLI